jgi:energy-coupling factor transporter ATP-binding protein EcfA2
VSIEEVVLADAKKKLVLDTVKHFDTFTIASKQLELHKKLTYGRGLVLLFYGPSGTGKTMMANALAALIGKKARPHTTTPRRDQRQPQCGAAVRAGDELTDEPPEAVDTALPQRTPSREMAIGLLGATDPTPSLTSLGCCRC